MSESFDFPMVVRRLPRSMISGVPPDIMVMDPNRLTFLGFSAIVPAKSLYQTRPLLGVLAEP